MCIIFYSLRFIKVLDSSLGFHVQNSRIEVRYITILSLSHSNIFYIYLDLLNK